MSEFQHAGISVADLDRSVAWYAARFGFAEIKRFDKPEIGVRGAAMTLGTAGLEILQPRAPSRDAAAATTLAGHLSRLGANHLAIGVSNVAHCFEEFGAKGVELVGGLIDGRFFFCKDPDGTLIEVRQAA